MNILNNHLKNDNKKDLIIRNLVQFLHDLPNQSQFRPIIIQKLFEGMNKYEISKIIKYDKIQSKIC